TGLLVANAITEDIPHPEKQFVMAQGGGPYTDIEVLRYGWPEKRLHWFFSCSDGRSFEETTGGEGFRSDSSDAVNFLVAIALLIILATISELWIRRREPKSPPTAPTPSSPA